MRYRILGLDEVAKIGDQWRGSDFFWTDVAGLAGVTTRAWRKKLGGYPEFKIRRPIREVGNAGIKRKKAAGRRKQSRLSATQRARTPQRSVRRRTAPNLRSRSPSSRKGK